MKNIYNRNTILFLNGDIPSFTRIKKFIKKGDYIICADGGANKISDYPIIPHIILGDLDSLTRKNEKYFAQKGTEIRKISEQETTDFEKSLLYILENALDNVVVFGAYSISRPDHTLNNFSVMKRYKDVLNIRMIDENFEIRYLKNKEIIAAKKGTIISLMPMPVAEGIVTKGLEFPLKNEKLEFGKREGTLNKMSSDKAEISFKSGDLLLFKKSKG